MRHVNGMEGFRIGMFPMEGMEWNGMEDNYDDLDYDLFIFI